MTTPTTGNPPAGWYTDPSDPAAQRWFDGAGWTAHVQAPPAPAAPAPVAPVASVASVASQYGYEYGFGSGPSTPDAVSPEYRYGQPQAHATSRFGYPTDAGSGFGQVTPTVGSGLMQPVESHYLLPTTNLDDGTNTPARVALLVSVLAMFGVPIAAVAGIILSVVGLRRARTLEASGREPKGRGRARAALALSIIGAVIGGLLLMAVVQIAMDPGVGVVTYDSLAVETEIATGIATQTGIATTVQCPEQLVTSVATAFQCVAVDSTGLPTTVNVQLDAAGSVSWQIG